MIVNKGVAKGTNTNATNDSIGASEQVSKYITVSPSNSNITSKWEGVIEKFTDDIHPYYKSNKLRKHVAAAVLENSYGTLVHSHQLLQAWQNELKLAISESTLNSNTIMTAFKRVLESTISTPALTSGAVATFLAPIIVRTIYKMNAVDMFAVQPLKTPVGAFNYAVFEYQTDTKLFPQKAFANYPGQLFTINPYYSMNVFEIRLGVVFNNNAWSVYTQNGDDIIYPTIFRNYVRIDTNNGDLVIEVGDYSGNNNTQRLSNIGAIHNMPQVGFFFQQKPQYIRVNKANDPTPTTNFNNMYFEFYVKDVTLNAQITHEREEGFRVIIPASVLDNTGKVNYIRVLYTTDYEQFGKNPPIPSIGLRIQGIPVSVETRPIQARYTIEAERDLSAYFQMNIYETLTNFLVSHIAGEIDRRLIFEAFRSAFRYIKIRLGDLLVNTGGVINFQSIRDILYTIILQIQTAANDILRFNKIAKGNWVVVSTTTGALLEALSKLEGYVRDVDVNVPSTLTPTKVGKIGDIDVYVDAMLPDGIFLVGTKVPEDVAPFGAGVGLLPYALLPAHYDDLGKPVIAPETFTRHIGFVSRDAIVTVPFGNFMYSVLEIEDINKISGYLGNYTL